MNHRSYKPKQEAKPGKSWITPKAEKIKLDTSISVVLQSPPGDPFNVEDTPSGGFNPFK